VWMWRAMRSDEGASAPCTFRDRMSPRLTERESRGLIAAGCSRIRDGGLLFEGEVQRFRFTSSDGHLLSLCTQLLLPCCNRVGAWRQVLQVEAAILVRHRKIGMVENRNKTQ